MPSASILLALGALCHAALAAPMIDPRAINSADLAWPTQHPAHHPGSSESDDFLNAHEKFEVASIVNWGHDNDKHRGEAATPTTSSSSRSVPTKQPATSKVSVISKALSISSVKASATSQRPAAAATGAALAQGRSEYLFNLNSDLNNLVSVASKPCKYQIDTKPGNGYNDGDSSASKFGVHYCGDDADKPSFIWWKSNGDVDCDGSHEAGPCKIDPTHQDVTDSTWHDKPIDAQVVPYVVLSDDKYFHPESHGIKQMSPVAVICNGQLTWGVFADTNPLGQTGEVSVTLAQRCWGSSMSGDNGHDADDVVYISFPGSPAQTQYGGLNYTDLAAQGNALLSRLSSIASF